MGRYCRYCHSSDHALMNCDKENTRISCFNCNILGYLDKDCPHRNGPDSLGSLHKKARKVPNSSNMSPIIQVMSNQPSVVQKLHSVSSMFDGNNARGILELLRLANWRTAPHLVELVLRNIRRAEPVRKSMVLLSLVLPRLSRKGGWYAPTVIL